MIDGLDEHEANHNDSAGNGLPGNEGHFGAEHDQHQASGDQNTQEINTSQEPKDASRRSAANRFTDFLREQSQTPKQDYKKPAGDIENENGASKVLETVKDEYKPPTSRSMRRAKMVARSEDLVFSKIAQAITDSPTRDKYKSDEKELEELIGEWAEYIEEEGMNLPPWLGLVLIHLAIYGPKIPMIIKDVKRNKQIKADAANNIARSYEQTNQDTPKGLEPGLSLNDVNQPITHCKQCSKELKDFQIKKAQSFCSRDCSNKYKAEVKKASKVININPNQQS